MLTSASLVIRNSLDSREDSEEAGEVAGRGQNVLEDCLNQERHSLFQSGILTIASLVIRNQRRSQAHLNLECLPVHH